MSYYDTDEELQELRFEKYTREYRYLPPDEKHRLRRIAIEHYSHLEHNDKDTDFWDNFASEEHAIEELDHSIKELRLAYDGLSKDEIIELTHKVAQTRGGLPRTKSMMKMRIVEAMFPYRDVPHNTFY